MEIFLISEIEDFLSLKGPWDSLVGKDPEATPFQTFPWSYCWWKHLRGNKRLAILLCKDNRTVTGIFPMWVRTLENGIRVAEFIGSRGTDYLAPIVPNNHHAIYSSILTFLIESEMCDVINFEDVKAAHPMIGFLEQPNLQRQLVTEKRESSPCYVVELPKTWDEYLARLSKRTQRDIAYDRRYLRRYFSSVEFEFSANSQEFPNHVELHQKRRISLNTPGTYASEDVINFLGNVVSEWELGGILRLSMLKLNRSPVASILSCQWRDEIYALYVGFDPAFGKYGVGSVLYGYCIEESIRQGMRLYDLSRGRDDYKEKWGAVYRKNVGLLVSTSREKIERYKEGVMPLHAVMGYGPTRL